MIKKVSSCSLSRRSFLQSSTAASALFLSMSGASLLAGTKRVFGQHTNPNYTLTVEELEGRQVYNGKPLGPVMRVRAGENLDVELVNNLPALNDDCTDNMNRPHGLNTTNLHTHGLHVSPTTDSTGEFDADNVFVSVVPADQQVACAGDHGGHHSNYRFGRNSYRFEIPDDHASGTFWYHAHKHGSTADQVDDGLAGALIIEDPVGYMPSYIENAVEKILFITNREVLLVSADGNVEASPTITMQPGEVQRWRVINGTGNGTDYAFVRPSIDNLDMHLIAYDGLAQFKRVPVDYENEDEPWLNPSALSSGNRADFIVRAPAEGSARPSDGIFSAVGRLFGEAITRYIDIEIVVEGDAVDREWSDADQLPGPGPSLPMFDNTQLPTRELAFTGNMTIDREAFDGEMKQTFKLGTSEDWTVSNRTGALHVYHIHVNPFLVTEINGVALSPNDPLYRWQDTLGVPMSGSVGFKTRYETFTGKFVIHCHVLPHEDQGMMQIVEVVQ